MTRNEVELLNERNEGWTCLSCLSNVRLTRSNSSTSSCSQRNMRCDVAGSTNDHIVEMLKNISTEIHEIKQNQRVSSQQLAECIAKLNSQSQEIAQNKANVATCRDEIENVSKLQGELQIRVETLSSKVNQVESLSISAVEASSAMCSTDVSASEIVDRATRAVNIIIRGLPEDEHSSRDSDVARAREIISIIDSTVADNIVTVQRLGPAKANSDPSAPKNRPMRVTLASVAHTRTLLRKKKILSTTAFNKISITDDKTPQQLRELRELRAELKRRSDSGERGLTIKYKNGIPAIVTTQQKKN